MICRPSDPYLRCIEFSHGNERRHGTHHDAQKSTQITRPSTGCSAGGGAARVAAATQSKARAIDNETFKRTTPPWSDRATAPRRTAASEKPVATRVSEREARPSQPL
jgi:hypothetical protein